MILSGFVITHLLTNRKDSYSKYLSRRLCRIYPVYFVALTLAIILFYLGMPVYKIKEGAGWIHYLLPLSLFQGFVPNSLLMEGSRALFHPAWSLSVEFQFYLIAPFLLAAVTGRSGRNGLFLLAILFLLYLYSGLGYSRNFEIADVKFIYPHSSHIFHSIKYFFLGMGSYLLLKKYLDDNTITISYSKCVLWGIVIYCTTMAFTKNVGYSIWFAFLPFLFLEVASDSKDTFFAWVGRISYSTYLLHMIIISQVGYSVGGHGWERFFKLLVYSSPLILIVSYYSYLYIERPVILWAAKTDLFENYTEKVVGLFQEKKGALCCEQSKEK